MRIVIELPDDIGITLQKASGDISRTAIEAIACEGYRSGLMSRDEVGRLLRLSFWETEAFLKERHAELGYRDEDIDRDRDDIERASRG